MNVFISGGCKNGKSYCAQRIAKEQAEKLNKPLYYIATMIPHDEEDIARIRRHLSEREGWGFTTLEQGKNITDILKNTAVDKTGVFLLDSVTALLDNEMFDYRGNMDVEAPKRIKAEVLEFAATTGNAIFVSDYIYGDIIGNLSGDECSRDHGYSKTTEAYRKGLASIDRALVKQCDRVIEVVFGTQEIWK